MKVMQIRFSALALSLAFGSACSMNAEPTSPQLSAQTLSPNSAPRSPRPIPALSKKQHLLYVATFDSIEIFDTGVRHPKLVATLTKEVGTPNNPCLSRDGTLYVPSVHGGVAGFVVVYPFGRSSPSEVLPAIGPGEPKGCAVDAAGNLWVADFYLNEVYEYVKGQSTIGTIIYGIPCPDSVAFDATGNMYVASFGFVFLSACPPRAAIEVYAPGRTLPFETINAPNFNIFTDMAIDPRGTLYISNSLYILVYDLEKSKFSKKLRNGTVGIAAVAVDDRGELYGGSNVTKRRQRNDKSRIIEFAPGGTLPMSWRIPGTGRDNLINGLAAWPPAERH